MWAECGSHWVSCSLVVQGLTHTRRSEMPDSETRLACTEWIHRGREFLGGRDRSSGLPILGHLEVGWPPLACSGTVVVPLPSPQSDQVARWAPKPGGTLVTGRLRIYPEVPSRRRSTITRDVLCAALIVFFVWCGAQTYQLVDRLSVFGTAVADAGTSIQSGFGSAARAVGGVPIVGDSLAGALSGAGSGTGGNLTALGQQGTDYVHRLALFLGLLIALLPTLVLLIAVLPRRIRLIRSLAAAETVLSDLANPAVRQLLASRAAFGLPYGVLMQYTRDPFGDLAGGHLDGLLAAALEDAGLRGARA